MSKPHPEKCHPELVKRAYLASKDRGSAFSEYIRLRWRSTGRLAPGCDAKDFYAALDNFLKNNPELNRSD